MATGPAGQTAAAPDGYGRMRASRADREQAIDTLKAAYVQGRLTKDELDERLGRALVPLTYAELAALTEDLPAGLAPVDPLREGNRAKARVLVTLVAGVMLVAAIGNGIGSPLHVLAIVLLLSPVWMLALGGLLPLRSRLDRRAARRLPPGPGQGPPELPGRRPAGTGDDPALTGDHADPSGAEVRAQEPRRDPPDRSGRNVLTPPAVGPVPGPA